MHGHSYGFHVIDGSEGRKDPFASLFKYKAAPTKYVFYDYACSLSEYTLNREPEYFRQTRFFHDVFHSFNHKCGNAFKSKRFPEMRMNSEICEQFNSYLQRLKYTATHLGLAKYSFLLQMAIYKWNQRRTTILKKQYKILIQGSSY